MSPKPSPKFSPEIQAQLDQLKAIRARRGEGQQRRPILTNAVEQDIQRYRLTTTDVLQRGFYGGKSKRYRKSRK